MKQPFLSKKRNVALLAVLYTFLWGGAFPLVKMCMSSFQIASTDDVSKMLLAGVRFFCSGVITMIVSLLFGEEKEREEGNSSGKKIILIVLYGLLGTTLQYACTYIGLSHVDGSIGALLDQFCVFLIIIISGIFCAGDVLTASKIIGCCIGFLGILFTATGGLSFHLRFEGEGMMLTASLLQTAAYFVAKRAVNRFSALKFVGLSHLIGGFALIVYSLACGGKICVFPSRGIIILIGLACISSVAYVLSLLPLKYFAASEVSVFNLLIPVFGALLSGIYLKEDIFNLRYLIAFVLVIVGIYIVNLNCKIGVRANEARSSGR